MQRCMVLRREVGEVEVGDCCLAAASNNHVREEGLDSQARVQNPYLHYLIFLLAMILYICYVPPRSSLDSTSRSL